MGGDFKSFQSNQNSKVVIIIVLKKSLLPFVCVYVREKDGEVFNKCLKKREKVFRCVGQKVH